MHPTSEATADIAVIGLGIAGHAAVLALRGGGRSVVALAPTAIQSDDNRVGDSLSPTANAVLRDLGLSEAFALEPHRPANATYAVWGSSLLAERNAIVHTEGPGHVIDRAAFERMLAAATARTSAVGLAGALAQSQRCDDHWRLTLDDGRALRARFVLDCSGRRAVFAGAVARRQRADRLVAAYTFLTQHDDGVEPTPATLVEAVPDGWWYAALLPDKRISLALFSDPDLLPRGLSRNLAAWRGALAATTSIQRWLDSAGYRADSPPRLISAGTAWLTPAAGDGWAAAGDAAASFDPLSSHGITSALWSGRQAALAATAWLAGDGQPLTRYAATIDSAVRNFIAQRRAVYGQEYRFAGRPFWRRRNGMAKTAHSNAAADA